MKKFVSITGLITMVILANACSEDDTVEFVAAKGKLQKVAHCFPADLEHPYSAYEYKYDANGRQLRERFYVFGDLTYYSDKKYDGPERIIQELHYDGPVENDKVYEQNYTSYSDYEYDQEGKLITKTRYRTKGEMMSKVIYEYDELGRKIKESYFWPERNAIGGYLTFSYLEDGLPFQRLNYIFDDGTHQLELVEAVEYQYDEQGIRNKTYMFDGIKNGAPSEGFTPGVIEEYVYGKVTGKLFEIKNYDPYWGYYNNSVFRYIYY